MGRYSIEKVLCSAVRISKPRIATVLQILCELFDFSEERSIRSGSIYLYVLKPRDLCVIVYGVFCVYDRCNFLFVCRH